MKKNIPNWVLALLKLTTKKEIAEVSKTIDEKGISETSLLMKASEKYPNESFSDAHLELLEKVAEKIAAEKQALINEVLNEKPLFSFSELQKYSGFIEFLFRARKSEHIVDKLTELTANKPVPQEIINFAAEKYSQLNEGITSVIFEPLECLIDENKKHFVLYKEKYLFNYVKVMQYQTAVVTKQGTVIIQDYHDRIKII